jgi:predicted ATP-binding protein involved in virulence
MDTMRIDQLEVSNFRCFGSCDVRFHPQLTVFVAENGQGKSALLDAVAMALGPVVDELTGTRQSPGLDAADVRKVRRAAGAMEPMVPTTVSARGVLDGERLSWGIRRSSTSPYSRTATNGLTELRRCAQAMRSRLDQYATRNRDLPPPLPLIAYYGTGRLWAEERLTASRRRQDPTVHGRLGGYQDFAASTSSFKTFSTWYGDMVNQARSGTLAAVSPNESPVRFLSCVRDAVTKVLEPTGWTTIDWEWTLPLRDEQNRWRTEGEVVVEHTLHGRHPLSRLSDGVRNTVALVADVARRCVRLNPHFGQDAALRTPGVLLVDEVDMHLHPGWQQQFVGLLQAAFPQLQLIITTHSPQVLSTVDYESIRVITVENGSASFRQPEFQTRGVESADVLARVMGVHSVPNVDQARWLTEYRGLLQIGQDQSEHGVALWRDLLDHFGERHPVMDEIATLRRLQEFKRVHGLPGGRR